jgi:pyrophosphatase PpaX
MQYFSGRDSVEDLVHKYRTFNIDRHDALVTEFPGVHEVLGKLRAAGIKLGIVTSKVRITSEMGLRLCGLYDYFDSIVTVQDVKWPKPDPEGIRKALKELGSDVEGSLMVGDSHYDIEAAQNAGIPSAAVAWSLKGIPYLERYNPTYIIHDIRELLSITGVEEISIETNG